MTWRDRAIKVIHAALAALPADASPDAKKKALFVAWTGGPRENWPYKVWCEEVARALGRKKTGPTTKAARHARNAEAPLFREVEKRS